MIWEGREPSASHRCDAWLDGGQFKLIPKLPWTNLPHMTVPGLAAEIRSDVARVESA